MSESKRPYSRAVLEKTVLMRTESARRIIERQFQRVESSLYSLDVIQQIIGTPETVFQMESEVSRLMSDCLGLMDREYSRLGKLMEDHGITELPSYPDARTRMVRIASPQIGQYLCLVMKYDELMVRLDALWLYGVFSNRQKAQGSFLWQRTVIKMGRRIAAVHRRPANRGQAKQSAIELSPVEEANAPASMEGLG